MPTEEPGAPDAFLELAETYAQAGHELAAVTLMHVTLGVVADALAIVRRCFPGTPVGVYAEVGEWQAPAWVFNELSAQEYLAEAQRWVRAGVQIAGSCCGTSPEFTRALAGGLPKHIPGRATARAADTLTSAPIG